MKLPNIAYKVWDRTLLGLINTRDDIRHERDAFRAMRARSAEAGRLKAERQHARNAAFDASKPPKDTGTFSQIMSARFARYMGEGKVVLDSPPKSLAESSLVVNVKCKGCRNTFLVFKDAEKQCVSCGRVALSINDAVGPLEKY